MPQSAASAAVKRSRFYPAEDVRTPLNRNFTRKPTKLRSTITPGTVLIVLAGRFRGKRVVFLKQLESGLLLVTGPFAVNGVPLRRLNQVYAIATQLKVDVSGVNLPASVDDTYFKKAKKSKGKKSEEDFMAQGAAAAAGPIVSEEKKTLQKAVDAAIVGALAA
eukprot:CAMPEP_0197605316 /NCGR_PEP_ID=MMETSP1326-20131121/42926_1 /TAXON_ID=1155430 /ORGANISM="Genus nov. species nov., Strain RCC2288" /LENGTH=162 /DNA_ID=CAMNT_0043173099 /DNA_START=10 /DNA_END=494 /DNA_ORIENTATION=+